MPDQTPAPAPSPDAAPPSPSIQLSTPRTPPEGNALAEILHAAIKENAFSTVQQSPEPKAEPDPEPAKPKAKASKAKPAAPIPSALPDPTAALEEPAAPEPEPDEDEPKGLSAAQQTNWRSFRESKKIIQQKLSTVEAELAELKKNGHHNGEWLKEKELIVKERDDLRNALKIANVERDPRFQAYFTQREKVLTEQAKRIGGDQGTRLVAILGMPDSDQRTAALDEILSGLPLSAQSRIGALVNSIDGLRAEKEAELSKAGETFDTMQREEASKRAEFNSRAQKLMDDTLANTPFLKDREGDAEFNSANAATRELAKSIYSGNIDIQQKARASIWAAFAPRILHELKMRNDELEALKTENQQLRAAQPNGGSGGSTPDAQADEGPKQGENLASWLARTAANQGAFHGRGY